MLVMSVLGGWWANMEQSAPPGMRELPCGMFAILTTNGDELGSAFRWSRLSSQTWYRCFSCLPPSKSFSFCPSNLSYSEWVRSSRSLLRRHRNRILHPSKGSSSQQSTWLTPLMPMPHVPKSPPPSALRILTRVMAHKAREPLVIAIACGLIYNLLGPTSSDDAVLPDRWGEFHIWIPPERHGWRGAPLLHRGHHLQAW